MRAGEQGRSTWAWLVTLSACVVLVVVATVAVWWFASREERVTSYTVRGSLGAISLDLGDADAEIVGGRDEPVVEVRRTDTFAFGHPAASGRELVDGVLRLRSRCPATVLGTCRAEYRLSVPEQRPDHRHDRVGRRAARGVPRLGADRHPVR